MAVSVRVVVTCERSKTISTEPQFQEMVSVFWIFESTHLEEFSVQIFDDVFHYVGVSR